MAFLVPNRDRPKATEQMRGILLRESTFNLWIREKNSLGEYGAFLQTISNVRNFVLKNSAKITPQNCPKILRNLTFVVQFSACFRTDHFIKT